MRANGNRVKSRGRQKGPHDEGQRAYHIESTFGGPHRHRVSIVIDYIDEGRSSINQASPLVPCTSCYCFQASKVLYFYTGLLLAIWCECEQIKSDEKLPSWKRKHKHIEKRLKQEKKLVNYMAILSFVVFFLRVQMEKVSLPLAWAKSSCTVGDCCDDLRLEDERRPMTTWTCAWKTS